MVGLTSFIHCMFVKLIDKELRGPDATYYTWNIYFISFDNQSDDSCRVSEWVKSVDQCSSWDREVPGSIPALAKLFHLYSRTDEILIGRNDLHVVYGLRSL